MSLLQQVKGVGTQIALTYVLTIEDIRSPIRATVLPDRGDDQRWSSLPRQRYQDRLVEKLAFRRSERATFRLRRLRGKPATVCLWQMPFPTTQLLSVEEFSMVAAVLRFTPSECGFIDLFPNPSLSCLDFCSAVGAYVSVAGDHFHLLLDDVMRSSDRK